MSLVTVSTKRRRVYTRAFDHDEARRLHAEKDWGWARLARHFGVSTTAVQRVCDPDMAERMRQTAIERMRRKRKPCRGGCGALVWPHRGNRSGLCPACVTRRRAASNVRDDELRCTRCGEWKLDDNFSPGGPEVRRGRRSWCRKCESTARAEHRAARPDLVAAAEERRRLRRVARQEIRMTDWTVLRRVEGKGWQEVGVTNATNRTHAIERVAKEAGNYAAVKSGQLTEFEVGSVQAFKVVGGTQKADPVVEEDGDDPADAERQHAEV